MTGSPKTGLWAWPWELNRRGVLGLNRRNLDVLPECNPPKLCHRADDKVLTKQICEKAGIPVPRTYAIVERYGAIAALGETLKDLGEYVVKPARGSGGRGVLIVTGRDGSSVRSADGEAVSHDDLLFHVHAILSGTYSVGSGYDRAIVEERIGMHPFFRELSSGGTPDLRIIVHRDSPVMAMLRLPTEASGGRANLHQGALGVGVDPDTGITLGGVIDGVVVDGHPDTGRRVGGLAIPEFGRMRAIACKVGEVIGLGYLGVDLMLDAKRGALVLEANARPGLGIQVANRAGLLARMESIAV